MPPYKKQPTREEMECIYSHKYDCHCQNTQEIQEWELNMQNHLISACDWIEDVKIKQMTVAKILSRWAVVRDEFSQKLKEQEERHKREIEFYFSKLGATDKTFEIYQDIKNDVLNILKKYE
jgi:hypothetical protein